MSMENLIEKNEALTSEEKAKFGYFGQGAKIRPPFRILNPQNIYVEDFVSIREFVYLHAYTDLTKLHPYIDARYRGDFSLEQYRYCSKIVIGRETQIGRNLLISCTKFVEIGSNVTISERVLIADNNHTFAHPHVPIMQQPNKQGIPIRIGRGSWFGAGASILPGTILGRNTVVGTNSVVQGEFPDYAVIGPVKAALLFIRHFDLPVQPSPARNDGVPPDVSTRESNSNSGDVERS